MRVLDLSFRDPAMNLALDEVLLDSAERGIAGESLRFWESPVPFVVLGVSQRLAKEADEAACLADAVPVLRRASAGGCVLQGPGCLNFNLVLSMDRDPALRNIRDSYCHILCRIREALAQRGVQAHLEGVSDLAVDNLKVSGNAQKRRKYNLLHHGTLLYGIDHEALKRYLREPEDRPGYRADRTHDQFVSVLPLTARDLREAVCEAFGAEFEFAEPTLTEFAEARALAQAKYSSDAWTHRR